MSLPANPETFLANAPLFRALSPEELARVAARARVQRAMRGEILVHRGDPANGFHVIVYGQIKLSFSSRRGVDKVVDILGPGQSFGEAVMFLERAHIVDARALQDSLLIYLERQAIFDEIERDPGFARRMIAGLARRLHDRLHDLEDISVRNGTQRLIGYLLNTDEARRESRSVEVELVTAKGIMASRLNVTQEHFSRILHELSASGLIEVDGRTVRIPDVEKLRLHMD